MLQLFSQSFIPPIVLIYVDDNIKNRTNISNSSYFGPQKFFPKTLKMQSYQKQTNKNTHAPKKKKKRSNSKQPAAMLNPKRSKLVEKKNWIIFIKSVSSHYHHILEIHCSFSVELQRTPKTTIILIYFRLREILVVLNFWDVFDKMRSNHTIDFAFSYLTQSDIEEVKNIPTLQEY